jgi:hypothetical protein
MFQPLVGAPPTKGIIFFNETKSYNIIKKHTFPLGGQDK